MQGGKTDDGQRAARLRRTVDYGELGSRAGQRCCAPRDRDRAVIPRAEVVDAQIAAIKAGSDELLSKTFDRGAVVLARTGHEVDEPELARTLGQIGPHQRVVEIKLNKLVAGGNDHAVWLRAELAISKRNEEPQEKPSTVTEVLRSVAAGTDRRDRAGRSPLPPPRGSM